MSSHSANEIIGDWNNLKGTHYHLVFALWLIVRGQASSVEFYQGNDLLAHSSTDSEKTSNARFGVNSNSESSLNPGFPSDAEPVDLWIQLKATKSRWTRSKLLEENLLLNFIYNAIGSNKRGHKWKARLVSQGAVDKEEILEFTAAREKFIQLNKTLDRIIDKAHKEIIENAPTRIVSREEIVEIALTILEQIAAEEPVPLEVLQSQIESELTLAFPARETVNQIGNLLIGGMIADSAAGPETARVYNAEWINKTAQRPVIRLDLLDENVGSACNAAVQRIAALAGYEPDRVVSREAFGEASSRYLASDRTCFVVLGTNGAGKSWASADLGVSYLKDKARLLIRGIEFDSEKRLEDLVANELKRYSSSNWSNAQYLKKFSAFPREENHPSFVIILDDLTPTGNIESYRHNLGRLARDCKDVGAKLVVTCQQHLWNFLNLGKDIERSDIFPPALANGDVPRGTYSDVVRSTATDQPDDEIGVSLVPKDGFKNYSFILSDFSPEEMEKALRRRLPEPAATIVFNQLRLPAFLALRKPFFFDLYFEQNESRLREPKEVPSAYVDKLLDWDEKHAVERAAGELELSESDLGPALTLLTEALWINRPNGLGYSEALAILSAAIAEKASDLVKVWRKTGFLTIEGNINFAQSLVADRIFARFVDRKSNETNFDFLNELDPGKDFGTVVAYLRQSGQPSVPGEKLIKNNSDWTSAVVAGLAQSASDDWRVLAMLSGLLSEHEYSELSAEIYNALGQLAARSDRTFKWVAEMYLGDRAQTWHRGALALISTLEYEPRRVEKAIRARLSRLVQINRDFFERDKRKKWILVNALDPFRRVRHPSAASVGRRIINRYQSLLGSDEVGNRRYRDWYFVDDVDEIRGQIAQFDAHELDSLHSDLRAENPVLRYRAAQAFIKLAIARPEIAKDALCRQIEQENDSAVFKRLLIAAYHLIEEYSGLLLSALSRSPGLNFAEGFRRADGLIFELLGNLAGKNPREVSKLLPAGLDPRKPDLQALLGEIFIYAHWRLRESSDCVADRTPFEVFDRLDFSTVTEEIRPFAIRSHAVSMLARMCLDLDIKADELTGRQRFYPNLDEEFLFVDFGEFFGKHLANLSGHELFEQFKQLLLDCVRQSDPVNLHPFSRLRNAVFRCGGECLELLTEIAAVMPKPVPLLDAIPHGWQAIRVLTALFKRGKKDAPIIQFAQQVLREQNTKSTIQADAESRELLAQIGLLENDPEQSLRDQRDAANRLSFFSDSTNAHGIAVFTTQNPGRFLEYLEAGILTVDDVPTLYALVDEARNWQAVLIARVYARMVSERPISLREGRDLCEQMLVAVRSMLPSAVKHEYENIYLSILTLLNGETLHLVSARNLIGDIEGIIANSHKLSVDILSRISNTPADQRTKRWFDELLYERRWWEESDQFILKDALLIQGNGHHQTYFFPAVRLALLAASSSVTVRSGDSVVQIMRERREISKILKNHEFLFSQKDLRNQGEAMLRYAFEDFDRAARNAPRDERVEKMRGAVLLRLGRFTEAETAFKKSLAIPTSSGSFRAGTLYDLACVYAGQNRFDDCRQALAESAVFRPLNKEWMAQDADLDPVRYEEWFQKLLDENTE